MQSGTVSSIIQAYLFSPTVLWVVFGIVVIVVGVLSAILIYHWRQFGMGKRIFNQVELLYLTGAIVLTLGALIALFLYTI
jgi:hypothetical protein